MKDRIKKTAHIVLTAAAWIVMLLMPIVSYLVFESLTGNLVNISRFDSLLNLLFYYAFYIFIFALSGDTRIAIPVSSATLFIFGAAEYFTLTYSGHPITVHNLMALNTLGEVVHNYRFEPTAQMKQFAAILLGMNIPLLFFPFRMKKLWSRLLCLLLCGAMSVGLLMSFFMYFIPHYRLTLNQWDQSVTYEERGYMFATGLVIYDNHIDKPKGYSKERISQIMRGVEAFEENAENAEAAADSTANADAGSISPVNIICIMNESLSDLSVAGNFTVNEDYLPYLHSLMEEGRLDYGNICVPVFGSGTSDSEFEVLMSDSMGLLPYNINPYTDFVRENAGSLVSTLKSQGYRAVAMHAMAAENWDRDKAYANMGFDEFLDLNGYYNNYPSLFLGSFLSDQTDYERILDQLHEKKSADEKLFVFNVTIQNHGGYEGEIEEEIPDIRLTGELAGKYPQTERYLSMLKASDDALKYLFEALENVEEPTMVVMFGDHQPSVEDGFYEDIADFSTENVTPGNRLKWYQTPYLIWKNYGDGGTELPATSTIYLSTLLLEEAGLQESGYNRFLKMLQDYFPIIQTNVLVDRDGHYYNWKEAVDPAVCPYAEMIQNYKILVYDHLIAGTSDIFHLNSSF